MLEIRKYNPGLKEKFRLEKARLADILPGSAIIEHIGSTAVGIGGKNIIDILVGVNEDEFENTLELLCKNGYVPGSPTGEKRIFLANTTFETGEGDFHIHLCLNGSGEFKKFIVLRDYLIKNPSEATAYFEEKNRIAKVANNDRHKYRELKTAYMEKLMEKALKKASQ